jgi:uncharacterized protein YndB with AHSA1/START domain
MSPSAAMGKYRFTTHIAAPPEKVFDLWVSLDRMAEWVEGVTKVTDVTGPSDHAGTRYTVWFGRMRSPTQILEAERPRFIRSRFGSVVLRGETQATFEPDGNGTLLTQEFRTQGIIPAIAARIFATGSGKGSFRGELATFARIAEREASG